MINLDNLKRKPKSEEYIGARVSEDVKAALTQFVDDNDLSVSVLLTALLTELLQSKGYLKREGGSRGKL